MPRMDAIFTEIEKDVFKLGVIEGQQKAEKKYLERNEELNHIIHLFTITNGHLMKQVSDLDREDPIGGIAITRKKARLFIRIIARHMAPNNENGYLSHIQYLQKLLDEDQKILEPTNGKEEKSQEETS